MNKKSHKKKQQKRRMRTQDGKNKENVDVNDNVTAGDDNLDDVDDKSDVCYDVKTSDIMGRYLVANRHIPAGALILTAPALVVGPGAGCPPLCLGCYLVLEPQDFNKYLVANRHIPAGALILTAPALVVGPGAGCPPLCLGCYLVLEPQDFNKCPKCSWPVCQVDCPALGHDTGHSQHECEVLARITPRYHNWELLRDDYYAITPLRCLLLKKHDPSAWATLTSMEAHNQLRMARGDIWPFNQTHVVDRIRVDWGLDYEEEEIHTVCGVLEVNAFEVGVSGRSARGLYARAHLLAHCCVPSTAHTDCPAPGTRPLTLRAAVDHRAGDLLTLCYAYTLQGTLRRRSHLQHSKFFSCVCIRCSDKTELGTYASALICPQCGTNEPQSKPNPVQNPKPCAKHINQSNQSKVQNPFESQTVPVKPQVSPFESQLSPNESELSPNESQLSPNESQSSHESGLKTKEPPCVLPVDPLCAESEWKCSHCCYTIQANSVDALLKRLTDDLDSIDANDVTGFENFLHKYRNVLHRNHYLNLSSKHSLSQLYGKVSDYMIGEMTTQQLLRKIEICRDLMRVFDVLEPGLSRLRGITLYELHAPLMILTTRDFEKKAISKDTLRIRLKEVVSCLRQAARILQVEPPASPEGLMAAAAKDALTKITTWELIIGKI